MKSLPYLLLIIIGLVVFLTSCSTTKNVNRQSSSIDSTVVTEKFDSGYYYREVIKFYEETIKGMESTGIQFETTPLILDSAANSNIGYLDTNMVLIGDAKDLGKAVFDYKIYNGRTIMRLKEVPKGGNFLKVNADGSIEATGVKSYNNTKLIEKNIRSEYMSRIDSFALELDKTKSELKKVQESKVAIKKRKGFPWWLVISGAFILIFAIYWVNRDKKFPQIKSPK